MPAKAPSDTPIDFPRPHDRLGHAWGLVGTEPLEIWERFSPAYEQRLQRLVLALDAAGYSIRISGAGGQDGEYISAQKPHSPSIFQSLEDPAETGAIEKLIASLTEL